MGDVGVVRPGVRLRAHAKVNYAVEILGVRPDGYHEISTVFQSISLADELEVLRAGEGFALHAEPKEADVGALRTNTVFKAWTLLRERSGEELPVEVRLRKHVPAGAGLGGGSADGAAALVGIDRLYRLGLGDDELRELAARIGADVPFCLVGGTALGEGVGERLETLPPPPQHHLVVARPETGANTAEIYRAYDRSLSERVDATQHVVGALRAGDLHTLARSVGNDLAFVTEALLPEVRGLRRALEKSGALGAVMSGSGTAVLAIFEDEDHAREACRGVDAHFAAVCRPVGKGVQILACETEPG